MKTQDVVIGSKLQQCPVRHGFACYPSEYLPNEIWDNGNDWLLVTTDYIYFNAIGLTRGWVTIPPRSCGDSASSGRGLGRAVYGRGKNARAGAIHDLLYAIDTPCPHLTRAQADEILYRASIYAGCPRWRARLAWLAVRLFGGFSWKKERMGVKPCSKSTPTQS